MNTRFTWALLPLLWLPFRSSASITLYSTQFLPSQGYNPAYELVGQQGWTTDSSSYGGNGLVTNFMGKQAAFIGLFPLNPPTDHLDVWQPLNYSPLAKGNPVVNFSVVLSIVDSTDTNYDDFYWSVYNQKSQQLFTVDFYNLDHGIYYLLDKTNSPYVYTGMVFTNNAVYTLGLTMDFAHNVWNATLNGAPLVTNQPMTVTGAQLDLGDIDPLWVIANPASPGDNFMIFDNYTVTAQPLTPAVLSGLGRTSSGQFLLQLTGPSGASYAIDASSNLVNWTALKTNVITGGSFDFIDTGAASLPARFYRAREVK